MNAREIIETKITMLTNEFREAQERLNQINDTRSQLQSRLVQIDGTVYELNEVLKNMEAEEQQELAQANQSEPVVEEEIKDDSECEAQEKSDPDESGNN